MAAHNALKGVTVGIVGAGALGTAFALALAAQGAQVQQIVSRTRESAQRLAAQLPNALTVEAQQLAPQLAIVLLALPELALQQVVTQLTPSPTTLFVHTAGSTPITVLQSLGQRHGALWPVQTFTLGRPLALTEVPLVVSAAAPAQGLLLQLAHTLSKKVLLATDEQRQRMHLGAVLVANFTNHLVRTAEQLLPAELVDYKIYLPLLQEVVAKLNQLSPHQAQTGPARRGEVVTISQHEALLQQQDPLLAQLYHIFSTRIAADEQLNAAAN